jgi:hypothetical protein
VSDHTETSIGLFLLGGVFLEQGDHESGVSTQIAVAAGCCNVLSVIGKKCFGF